MKINVENLNAIQNFNQEIIDSYKLKYNNTIPELNDKIEHIFRVKEIATKHWNNDPLIVTSAFTHDIGRFLQYDLLGKFDDITLSHHYIGTHILSRAIAQGKLKMSKELDVINTVVTYHGRSQYIPFNKKLPRYAKKVLDIISRIDAIENGCLGAISYIVRECETDAKNYKKNNPELDMKMLSPNVCNFICEGKSFDKIKYCNTYADYVVFAVSLAIKSLRGKDRVIAKDIMKNYTCCRPVKDDLGNVIIKTYSNAVEGYEEILGILLYEDDKNLIMKILKGFFDDPNYRIN